MLYKNDQQGREEVLKEITTLLEQGYSRHDVVNEMVVMQKTIASGNVVSKANVIEFRHIEEAGEIKREEYIVKDGIREILMVLDGWDAPAIEIDNAISQGLLTEVDKQLIREEYSEAQWLGKERWKRE